MSHIIDRRLNARGKSSVNRARFLERQRKHIRQAVAKVFKDGSVTDAPTGHDIAIPREDTVEPRMGYGRGGRVRRVLPGNDRFNAGDRIERPPGGRGGPGGDAGDSGEGLDEFVFQLSEAEFLNYLFDDLELPNLMQKSLQDTDEVAWQRAGFSSIGVPAKLDVKRSMCQARGRRVALGAAARRRVRRLEEALAEESDDRARAKLLQDLEEARKRARRVPFLDDIDLRFRLDTPQPQPASRAVMFCLMDVSGSMDQATKDKAKRFYYLLHLFLSRHYERTEIVFIRHHTEAREVDEQTFFHSRETGGTIVSSALRLMQDVIAARYPASEWNIYAAQATDGDNWPDDNAVCRNLLDEAVLPLVSHYAYVEISSRPPQAMQAMFEALATDTPDRIGVVRIADDGDVFPAFRKLFEAKTT